MQLVYAHLHRDKVSLSAAEADMKLALSRTYDLYLYLLRLPIALTSHFAELQELRRRKHLATEAEKNPNYRLQDNKFVSQLRISELLEQWYEKSPYSWEQETSLLRKLSLAIEQSVLYQDYLKTEASYEVDRNFWFEALRQIVFPDQDLAEHLEGQSIYWDNPLCYIEKISCEEHPGLDDEDIQIAISQAKGDANYSKQDYEGSSVEITKAFSLKSIKRAEEHESIDLVILPQYRTEDEESFALLLVRQTLLSYDKTSQLISQHLSAAWDKERLADIDELIIHLATTEFLYCPNIPTSITINEYIELSKHYSTSKSSSFINGVLDAIAKELKASKKILKQ